MYYIDNIVGKSFPIFEASSFPPFRDIMQGMVICCFVEWLHRYRAGSSTFVGAEKLISEKH